MRLLLPFLFFLFSCVAAQRPANHSHTRTIWLSGDFNTDQARWVLEGAQRVSAASRVNHVQISNPTLADVMVRQTIFPRCTEIAGMYDHFSHTVFIDPTCARNAGEWRALFMHELMHSLGAVHVCQEQVESLFHFCSPVGYGQAIMNPAFAVFAEPTALDVAELDRVLEVRRRIWAR